MAHHIDPKEWQNRQRAFESQSVAAMSEQQQLWRLVQYLDKQDYEKATALLDRGVAVDQLIRNPAVDNEGAPALGMYFQHIGKTLNFEPENLTALAIFAHENKPEPLAWLLANGAQANMAIDKGMDAAWVALLADADEAYDMLMEAGAAPSRVLTDGTRFTRLMMATVRRKVDAVSDMLRRHVNVGAFDNRGRLALHWSLSQDPYQEEDKEITRLLVLGHSSLEFEDNEGVTPEHRLTNPDQIALMRAERSLRQSPEPAPTATVEHEPGQDGPGGKAPQRRQRRRS